MSDVPDIEDSSVWGPQKVPPICPEQTFDEAIITVLEMGQMLRMCPACHSPATTIRSEEYELIPGEGIQVRVNESCADCGDTSVYHVQVAMWVAMEAMRVWEQGRTAKAAINLEMQGRADLAALDQQLEVGHVTPIPRALQWCRRCHRWLESRDGKAPCMCPSPVVSEGPPGA